MEEIRNECGILLRKPIGKQPLGRPRRRWEDHVDVDLRGLKMD
jgi:hypothetical protein